jgi:hypothetical protein
VELRLGIAASVQFRLCDWFARDPRLRRVDPAAADVDELAILSSPRGPSTIDLHDRCMRPSLMIVGAHNLSHPQVATQAEPWSPARHAELFFGLVRRGLIDVDRLISDRVPVREAPGVYERLVRDRTGLMGAPATTVPAAV